jgi:hypothetical protein
MATEVVATPRRRWWLVPLAAAAGLAIGFAAGFGAALLFVAGGAVQQTGTFRVVAGQEGVVNFPLAYGTHPPNVQLDLGGYNKTVVTECTVTGFKWKNVVADDVFNNAQVNWTARGER